MKKRAEQQKLAKLSSGRTQRSAPIAQTERSSLGSPAPSQRTSRAMERAAELAARRKAQLDELRSRREHRRAGFQQQPQQQQHPQVRIGPGSSQTPASSFRSTPQQIPQPTPVPTQRVVIRPSTPPKPPAPVSRSVFSDHTEHERADTQRLHGRRKQLAETDTWSTKDPARLTPTSPILDFGELTPELLRRMVVLKEIFDLPVSLRDRDVCDRL